MFFYFSTHWVWTYPGNNIRRTSHRVKKHLLKVKNFPLDLYHACTGRKNIKTMNTQKNFKIIQWKSTLSSKTMDVTNPLPLSGQYLSSVTDCHSFDLCHISQFTCASGLIRSSKWYPMTKSRSVNQTMFPGAGNQLPPLLNCQNSPWDGCVQGQLATPK